ncbi:hypothetical protein E2562_005003 [Oryza meyeriana var. granulata]|uniref:Uncharacterized protein n=1 Tax=Oryza meyeriana var. granulata TaxID=110450 RepID=A0A6G1C4D8_9ORYZ|nr:hypothetical protein E2562_005003 [Oryza meyeriana var. granulata]
MDSSETPKEHTELTHDIEKLEPKQEDVAQIVPEGNKNTFFIEMVERHVTGFYVLDFTRSWDAKDNIPVGIQEFLERIKN